MKKEKPKNGVIDLDNWTPWESKIPFFIDAVIREEEWAGIPNKEIDKDEKQK